MEEGHHQNFGIVDGLGTANNTAARPAAAAVHESEKGIESNSRSKSCDVASVVGAAGASTSIGNPTSVKVVPRTHSVAGTQAGGGGGGFLRTVWGRKRLVDQNSHLHASSEFSHRRDRNCCLLMTALNLLVLFCTVVIGSQRLLVEDDTYPPHRDSSHAMTTTTTFEKYEQRLANTTTDARPSVEGGNTVETQELNVRESVAATSTSSKRSTMLSSLALASIDDICPGLIPPFPFMAYDTFLRTSIAMPDHAYVTFITSPHYVREAATLMYSIAATGSVSARCILVTNSIPLEDQQYLALFAQVIVIEPVPSPMNIDNQQYKDTFTKLRVWQLEPLYSKILYLDTDVIITQNIDELFDLRLDEKGWGTADWVAPIDGGSSRYSSGMMLLRPSLAMFDRMVVSLREDSTREMMDLPDLLFLKMFFEDVWPIVAALKAAGKYDSALVAAAAAALAGGGSSSKLRVLERAALEQHHVHLASPKILMFSRWYQVYQSQFGRHYATFLTERWHKLTIFDARIKGIHYPTRNKPWLVRADDQNKQALYASVLSTAFNTSLVREIVGRLNPQSRQQEQKEDQQLAVVVSTDEYKMLRNDPLVGHTSFDPTVRGGGGATLDARFEERMQRYSVGFCAWRDYVRYYKGSLGSRRYGGVDTAFRTNRKADHHHGGGDGGLIRGLKSALNVENPLRARQGKINTWRKMLASGGSSSSLSRVKTVSFYKHHDVPLASLPRNHQNLIYTKRREVSAAMGSRETREEDREGGQVFCDATAQDRFLFSRSEARERMRPFVFDPKFWWFLNYKRMINGVGKIVRYRSSMPDTATSPATNSIVASSLLALDEAAARAFFMSATRKEKEEREVEENRTILVHNGLGEAPYCDVYLTDLAAVSNNDDEDEDIIPVEELSSSLSSSASDDPPQISSSEGARAARDIVKEKRKRGESVQSPDAAGNGLYTPFGTDWRSLMNGHDRSQRSRRVRLTLSTAWGYSSVPQLCAGNAGAGKDGGARVPLFGCELRDIISYWVGH